MPIQLPVIALLAILAAIIDGCSRARDYLFFRCWTELEKLY